MPLRVAQQTIRREDALARGRELVEEVRALLEKAKAKHLGDAPGHPFRGNQWSEGGALEPGTLKDEPARYFHIDDQTEMVPLSKLQTIRARPEGIAHAEPLMQKAYEGQGGKRKPISLEKQADGTYTVLDGNSTTAIARKHRWEKIPAHVSIAPTALSFYRAKLALLLGGSGSGNFGHAGRPGEIGGSAGGKGTPGKGRGTPKGRAVTPRTGLDQNVERMIKELNHERAVPNTVRPATTEAKADATEALQAVVGAKNPLQPLYPPEHTDNDEAFKVLSKETKTSKIPVEHVLDALGGNAKAQFAELRKKGETANPVMHAIADDIKEHLGGTAITKAGDIKSLDRSVKKVVGKDNGDARNVRDVVRSSVAVEHVDDLDDALAAVHAAVKRAGGSIVTAEDRFRKPMAETGYRDMNINVRMPNGIVGEIQVHLKSMLKAKDFGGGHELYEQFRTIQERGNHRPLTVAERSEMRRLSTKSRRLYNAAWKAGGGRSND